MKLIKLSSDHYIIVDESKQPVEGYYYDEFIRDIRNTRGAEYGQANHCWQITHSTKPLEYSPKIGKYWNNVQPISLSEVRELLGEDVDVEKKATDYANTFIGEESTADVDYKAGYIVALEDNKDRIKNILMEYDLMVKKHLLMYSIEHSIHGKICEGLSVVRNEYIQSLQPPTSWDVEFVNGKLKLV